MSIDDRIKALRVNIGILHETAGRLLATAERDGENIRVLARVAERRLTELEGDTGTAQ